MNIEGNFAANGYVVIRHLLTPEIGRLLFDYVCLKHTTGQMVAPDERIADAPRLCADSLTETLLLQKQADIEAIVDASLWPSHSYVRLHGRHAAMPVHTDRNASELGVTFHAGGDQLWPFHLRTAEGDISVVLDVGDAVLYCGQKLPHWREPYLGEVQVQCMLFYVRQEGEYAAFRYDGRAAAGLPYHISTGDVADGRPLDAQ